MGYVAKLTQGIYSLDLSSGRYDLGMDFTPPRTDIIPNLAGGTSANRYGGSIKVSERAVNGAMGFSVRVQGDSNAEIERGVRDIQAFLNRAGDEADPVYLEWRPDSNVSYEPLWGQFGANLRVEVVNGSVDRWGNYFTAQTRNSAVFAFISLIFKPFAMGKRQRLATAKGGIFTNTLGRTDGNPTGIVIAEETTNWFTNPVFGHSTWNTNWVAGANLITSQNTDPNFILFGDSSAKLVNPTAGAISYREVITVGTNASFILSCYAKRADSDTVGSTDLALYYGSALTTGYSSVGDGWWRAAATVTGAGTTATNTGLNVAAKQSIYVDGFQLENKNYATPLAHGDMLGCSWAGTAHASTTARAVSFLRLPYSDAINVAEGTIRYVWKAPCSSAVYDGAVINARLMKSSSTAAFVLSWNATTSEWNFTDGTSTITPVGSTPFSAGEIIIFHCVYGPGVLKLYQNGVEIATDSTYTQPALSSYLYIGSTDTPDLHNNGVVMGWASYAYAMSATEVLSDYTNIAAITADGQQVEPIPYLWTKDGDNILDPFDDADQDNYAVINGISGNVPAITEMVIADAAYTSKYIAVSHPQRFLYPDVQNLLELGGSADTAGTASNNDYAQDTIGTAFYGIYDTLSVRDPYQYIGNVHFFSRMKFSGTAIFTAYPIVYYTSSASGEISGGITAPISSSTAYNVEYIGNMAMKNNDWEPRNQRVMRYGVAYKSVSGATTMRRDYELFIPGELMKISSPTSGTPQSLVIKGVDAYWTNPSGGLGEYQIVAPAYPQGDTIEFHPDKYNVLWIFHTQANTSTHTMSGVYITPKWSIS